ncbi:MAG: MATE family efflux transporter [Ruminococcaceae bacterium]|nr:MATE family efflux transporter [Oscillospiraceae bacterium]
MRKNSVNMLEGSLWKNILAFSIPVMLTGILQLLFNACDLIVVGQFTNDSRALAAVGATSSLTSLLVNAFMGLSVGVNVLAARCFGAKDTEGIQNAVHTAVTLSLICGVVLSVLGIVICKPCLVAMNTPEDVIDLSVLYMRIYFAGIPFTLLYNFCAAILRAHGNTKQPLIFLTIAGVVNVALNVVLVAAFHLSVEGVAIATAVSQLVASALVIHYLREPGSVYFLDFRRLRVHWASFKEILRVGIPAGMTSVLFAFSNIQIQSSINIFGSVAMAGNAAAASVDGFIYVTTNAFHHAALNFTGQNMGAGRGDRISKIMGVSLVYALVFGTVLSAVFYLFGEFFLGFYTKEAAAISYGMTRLLIVGLLYFLCGGFEVVIGVLRGMGYSVMPTIIVLVGVCGLRILWISTIFKAYLDYQVLLLSYPVSWLLTMMFSFVYYLFVAGKLKRKALQ